VNPRGQWFVVGSAEFPYWEHIEIPRRHILRGTSLPAKLRQVAPGDTVGRRDMRQGGEIHLLLHRTAGQSAGVTAAYPIPPLERGLLGELVRLSVGPDPDRRPGRREHITVVALSPAGTVTPYAAGPEQVEGFRFGLPMFTVPAASGSLVATVPKVGDAQRWELRVTTDRRSAGYAVIVTMQVIEKAALERLFFALPALRMTI
jgi:hypothetical protein